MCVPSRLSLMAGQYVHQIGAWDNGVIPRPSFRTWGHHLREAGYTSVIAGRTHFNGPDRLLGFDRRLTDDLDFSLLRHGFRNDEPLTQEELREATVCYWALVSHLDHQIGRLLAAVPDDTVVIYTSDHGEMAGHHGIWQKQCFYEPAVRIPLLLRHPSVQPGRNHDHVSLVDVLPTLRDIAGLTPDPALPGRTLLDPVDRPVLSEYHAQGMVDGGFMLKSGPWKYCYYGAAQRPQVFNVDTDPLELHDLSTDEALVAKLDSELRSILDPDRIDVLAKSDQAERLATLTRG
jgi:choline-sulfatase